MFATIRDKKRIQSSNCVVLCCVYVCVCCVFLLVQTHIGGFPAEAVLGQPGALGLACGEVCGLEEEGA